MPRRADTSRAVAPREAEPRPGLRPRALPPKELVGWRLTVPRRAAKYSNTAWKLKTCRLAAIGEVGWEPGGRRQEDKPDTDNRPESSKARSAWLSAAGSCDSLGRRILPRRPRRRTRGRAFSCGFLLSADVPADTG